MVKFDFFGFCIFAFLSFICFLAYKVAIVFSWAGLVNGFRVAIPILSFFFLGIWAIFAIIGLMVLFVEIEDRLIAHRKN